MSTSSVVKPAHFKIHVAKAKDLPLSWYDLVLRPQKFAEHLEILSKDPEGKNFFNLLYFLMLSQRLDSVVCSY